MGKVIELDAGEVPRLWVVYGETGRPLQLFKGKKAEAEEGASKAYPLRAPFKVVEAVDCLASDVAFVTSLAFGEWLITQFAMIAQMTSQVQRVVPGMPSIPPVPRKH